MSKLVGEIEGADVGVIGFGGYTEAKKPSRLRRAALIAAGILAAAVVITAVGGYLYWKSLEKTPQYSLAQLVDAARNDDQETINRLVDTDALVDNFMPQITSKAIELYGRGVPPGTLARVAQVAAPLMPAVKDRARAALPGVIRRKTEKLERIPFAALVIGADRYLDISLQDANTAIVKSREPEHSFEVEMKREGDAWKVVGVRDEQLATNIARAVGQEIIAAASNGGVNSPKNTLGVKNIGDVLRQAEEIFK